MTTTLHIDASSQSAPNSISRKLSQSLVQRFSDDNTSVIYRDVSQGLPFVSEFMIEAYFTPDEDRSNEQNQAIALSDKIVEEISTSDIVVIGAPMYNFSVPASLKAWADLIARVGVTFQYTENGPIGLLENKKAYVAVATGGIPIDSPADFLTPWVRELLDFLGIADIETIGAEALTFNAEAAVQGAEEAIKMLAT